jgi:type I restriction enzyme S subunit
MLMMSKNNLPTSWSIANLDEIGEIISGGTPSTKIPEYWDGNISWITPADLSGYNKKRIDSGRKSISEKGLKNSSARLMPKGSVLFSSRAPIGYVVIANKEVCTNQGFKSIVPNKMVTSDFLYYYLKTSKRKAEELASGTTFKEISIKGMTQLDVPLPPLPEQHRIVAKLEELFSQLDSAVAALKIAKEQVKTYKQSVLKYAFEGRLGMQNVECKMQNEETGLPEGWKWVKLIDFGKWTGGGTPSKSKPEYWNEGEILWVSPKDMKYKIINETIDKITLKSVDESSAKLINQESVLFVVRSGILRRTLPVAICRKPFTVNQDLQAFTPNKNLSVDYVYWWVTYHGDSIIKSCSKNGTTVESIESSLLKNYLIPLCSVIVQEQIVLEIESRFSEVENLEKTIDLSLIQAESLRQSILKKAFEGRLVPQDPNDEPAEKLLERIKREKKM